MDAILTAVPWSGLGWGGLIFAAGTPAHHVGAELAPPITLP